MTKLPNTHQSSALGDYVFVRESFPNLDQVFGEFAQPTFLQLSMRKRFRRINQVLTDLIISAPKQSFLLPAVVEFIERVNHAKILNEPYHLPAFESWLNLFADLTDEQNYEIRAKIVGRYVPRDEYQAFFPIGMNKTFNGTHFVAAHFSPDVDTMVASFWGWIDAFAARVGSARHLWSLPGGPPDSPVTHVFGDFFGPSVFTHVSSSASSLTLSAIDLVTQKGVQKNQGRSSISLFDSDSGDKAIILIDEQGHYLGDWHHADVDPIRQILIRFKSCLRWFETNLHVRLISLFAKKNLNTKDLPEFISSVFDVAIQDCEPVKEFTERQKSDLNDFFTKVLHVKSGLKSTFRELIQALNKLSVHELNLFQQDIEALKDSELFDEKGALREDRPLIFNRFEKIINRLDNAIFHTRDYVEQLDVAMKIKTKVLGTPPQFVTMRSNVDDIRIKMQRQEYLTVVVSEGDDLFFPVGVIWASALQQSILGTVSFRDFCNQEEVKMAPYLTPISVIDHHKASLKTSSPPMAIIGDAQSCNVLIAELSLDINSRYTLNDMQAGDIEEKLQTSAKEAYSSANARILQGLLQRRMALEANGEYFVHPNREIAEYLCYLHAILDDTDLLTKVSKRDIECVVRLLNRLKSLTSKQEVEVIHLDDIPKDKNFAKAAAKRVLRNSEMYSLYRKVYESKEKEVERNLQACEKAHYDNLFADTKEQNGCCRVGQTKLFTINFPTYLKQSTKLREYWLEQAKAVNAAHPEIDLHLQMVSTIPSAEEVYQDKVGHYQHQDEIWFWVAPTQRAYDHLSSFLTAFQAIQKFGSTGTIEFLQPVNEELQQIFSQNCPGIPLKITKDGKLPLIVMRFGAGLLNSRKAMITPYLPRIIT
ncbi:MAG: hypothetical protein H0X51_04355 [Parachlamydiaceae bacterium]|nr:hypothetical protein [Parachlamydiaceae bacterium]